MNAGAYGKEMKDVINEVSLLDADGEKKTMKREEISFGYRTTSFPCWHNNTGRSVQTGKR